jgi:hypothetical protein
MRIYSLRKCRVPVFPTLFFDTSYCTSEITYQWRQTAINLTNLFLCVCYQVRISGLPDRADWRTVKDFLRDQADPAFVDNIINGEGKYGYSFRTCYDMTLWCGVLCRVMKCFALFSWTRSSILFGVFKLLFCWNFLFFCLLIYLLIYLYVYERYFEKWWI